MIHVISGYIRSGTTMAMRACEAGGMSILKDEERDEFCNALSDEFYKPNPAGLYELTPKRIQNLTQPEAEGKLIKVVSPWLPYLPVLGGYKICFMLRDPLEIKESLIGMIAPDSWKPILLEDIAASIQNSITILKNRRDVDVSFLNYNDVISWPEAAMRFLASNGWPIDASKSAKIPEKHRKRFKARALAPIYADAGQG